VEFEIKLYVIGAPRKTVQILNPQLKLTVQSHQSCIYVCQLTVQRHQSCIYVCEIEVLRCIVFSNVCYIQYTDSIDRVHLRCIQYDCKRYVVYVQVSESTVWLSSSFLQYLSHPESGEVQLFSLFLLSST
jgi:hypothetical protein